jgi:hypothetical protein
VTFEDTAGAAEQSPLEHLLASTEDLVVEIAYTDIAGRQEAATSIYLTNSGEAGGAYRVTAVSPGGTRRFTRGLIGGPQV